MEIITSFSKLELEQLIVDSVQKCLNNRTIPPQVVESDEMDLDETCQFTGYKKATIYHKSFTGEMPASRRGKYSVFSRKEIIRWMQSQTIRKQSPAEIEALHLQESAKKKLK